MYPQGERIGSMKGMLGILLGAILIFVLSCALEKTVVVENEDVPLVSKEELKSKLESPDVVIVDVRTEEQWKHSNLMIPGAIHEDPKTVEARIEMYARNKTYIFY
jgi:uncharacterized iron-regulated protein